MPGGLNDELHALHARRAEAEKAIRDALGLWAFEHATQQTFGQVRALADELCEIAARAVLDAYNLPRPAIATPPPSPLGPVHPLGRGPNVLCAADERIV